MWWSIWDNAPASNPSNCILAETEPTPARVFPETLPFRFATKANPGGRLLKSTITPRRTMPHRRSSFLSNAKGRYVKVEATRLNEVDKGNHYFQLAEIEIFGKETTPTPLQVKPFETAKTTSLRRLRCENRENAVGMDAESPRFSWWMESPTRGQKQTAARVLVASSLELLAAEKADFWDSGKMDGDRSVAVVYRGKPLTSGKAFWWKVMAWDKDGKPTKWSEPDKFVTGKFKPEDWKGRWIGASEDPQHKPVYLRKEVKIDKPVKRATVFFCGLGQSELTIEGKKVGDCLFAPGFTTYDKRVQYLVFDVTDRFAEPGLKAIGAVLFDGWYGLVRDPWVHRFHEKPYIDKPKLLLDLHLEYEDGTEAVVSTDASWQWSYGPIRRAWLCEAEIDKRLDMPGWDVAGYSGKGWRNAAIVSGPKGTLVVQKEPPTRVVETIRPERLEFDAASKTWIYHFNREFTGFFCLRTSGTPGKQVRVITLPHDPTNPSVPARVNTYTFAGEGVEEFRPDFIYTSITQIRVQGAEKPLALGDLHCEADFRRGTGVGRFSLLERFGELAARSGAAKPKRATSPSCQTIPRGNSRLGCKTPTTCSNRRCICSNRRPCTNGGSTTSSTASGPTAICRTSPRGRMLTTSTTSAWWGGSGVWLPWHWNLYFGDSQLLRESYPGMKRYVDFLGTTAHDSVIEWGLGDWLPVQETPKPLINTPGYYFWAVIVSQAAKMANEPEEAKTIRRTRGADQVEV